MSDAYRTGAVELHQAALIELAIRFARERPGERAVAIVAEGDVDDAEFFQHATDENALRGEDGSVALLRSREEAKQFLVGNNVRALDFLVDEGDGPVRELPVVHVGVPGVRMESIRYKAPE